MKLQRFALALKSLKAKKRTEHFLDIGEEESSYEQQTAANYRLHHPRRGIGE